GVGRGQYAEPKFKASLRIALEIAELRQRVCQPRNCRSRQARMQCEIRVRQGTAAVAESGEHIESVRQGCRKRWIALVYRSGPGKHQQPLQAEAATEYSNRMHASVN